MQGRKWLRKLFHEKICQRRYVIIPCNRCKIIFISRILPVKSVWRSRTCKGISETGSGELNSFVYRINHTEEYAGTRAGKRGKIFLFGRGGLTATRCSNASRVSNAARLSSITVYTRELCKASRVKRSPLHFFSLFFSENDLVDNEVAIKMLYVPTNGFTEFNELFSTRHRVWIFISAFARNSFSAILNLLLSALWKRIDILVKWVNARVF